MNVLFYGVATFLIALLTHFIFWKFSLAKKNHTFLLLKIFLSVFIVAIIIFRIAPGMNFYGITLQESFFAYLQYFILYFSLALAYVATYSAVEVDSPSLIVVINIFKEGSKGLDKERLCRMMSDDMLIIPRITDLVNGKLICLDKNKYMLTWKGSLITNLFIFYRRLLRLPKGG